MTPFSPLLEGRTALVIGASAGIGRQIGLRLAAGGVEVAFHGRRRDRLDEAVAEAGGGVTVVAELESAEACASAVAEAVAHLGHIDLLVYAASASRLSLVQDTSAAEWTKVFTTNVIAPALVARAAIPHLTPGGISAFISSESVGMPYHGLIPYGSSKAALEEVVRGLRLEHPELRFSCIRVGQTGPTDFARDFDPALAGELLPKWIAIGRMPANAMDVTELGCAIADTITVNLAAPSIEMQDLVIRAPGGPFMGPASSILEDLDASRESGAT